MNFTKKFAKGHATRNVMTNIDGVWFVGMEFMSRSMFVHIKVTVN